MKNDDLIYEHILKPIQTDRRVWIAGGVTLALILIVALWPSKTEVVKAVVKHEITESETYQSLAEDLAEMQGKIGEKVEVVEEHAHVWVTGEDDVSTAISDRPINNVMDEELAFLNSIISDDARARLNKYESKTKEASASQYAHLHDMVTPLWQRAGLKHGRPLNEVELFFQKGITYTMNDQNTPGIITEWEARWISELYQAKKGHVAKQMMQGLKDEFMQRFRN